MFFPYNEAGTLIDINEDKFTGLRNYLTDFYDEIVPKQVSGKSVGRDIPNSTQKTWYQYGRTQAITEFNNQEKL